MDLLALDAVSDAVSAKAAIYAAGEVYRQLKQRVPPMLIHAVVDPSTGRTPGGQGLDAFYVSVKHAKPLIVGLVASSGSDLVMGAYGALCKVSQSFTGLRLGEEGQAPTSLSSDGEQGDEGWSAELAGRLRNGASHARQRTGAAPGLGSPTQFARSQQDLDALGATRFTRFLASAWWASVGAPGLQMASRLWWMTSRPRRIRKLDEGPRGLCRGRGEGRRHPGHLRGCIANDGSNRGSKAVFRKFVEMCDADERVSKAPLMLCSSEWKCLGRASQACRAAASQLDSATRTTVKS